MNQGTTLVAYRLDVSDYSFNTRKTVYCTSNNLIECIDSIEMQENDVLLISKIEVKL